MAIYMLISTAPPSPTFQVGQTVTSNWNDFTAVSTSRAYDISTCDTVRIHVFGDGGDTTSSCLIQTGPTATGPWFTEATITNATDGAVGGGSAWSIPRNDWVRISVASITPGGTLNAALSGWYMSNRVH